MNIKNVIKIGWHKYGGIVLDAGELTGVIFTAIFSAKDTPLALEAIDDADHAKMKKYIEGHPDDPNGEHYEGLTKIEKVKAAAPKYKRTMVSVAFTILCATLSKNRDYRIIKSLKLAKALMENKYDDILDVVESNVSKDKLNKINAELAQREIDRVDPPKLMDTTFKEDDGSHTYIIIGSPIRTTRNKVDAMMNDINARILEGEEFSNNNIRNMFGLKDVEGGDYVGYGNGEIIKYTVDLGKDELGNPVGVVNFKTPAKSIYDDVYSNCRFK